MTSESRFRRGGRWAAVILIAFLCGTLGGLVVFWVNGASTNPVISWFGDFLKSPGFTGLCAVIAAGIAIVGISLQIHASRQRDTDAAWWQSFEWASDRGLPRDRSELKLPADAAIDTLNALATAARTDIQRHAVGGVVDELVRTRVPDVLDSVQSDDKHDPGDILAKAPEAPGEISRREEAGGAKTDEEVSGSSEADAKADENPDVSDSRALALWRYAVDQMGTAAESRRAAKAGYEDEVFRALRHQFENVVRTHGRGPGDLMVEVGGRNLVIKTQWAPGPKQGSLERGRLHGVDVVITNAPAESVPRWLQQVVWNPRQGSSALRRRLEALR
ncbi:hypothetical protein [Microbacterium sp. NPDC055455]